MIPSMTCWSGADSTASASAGSKLNSVNLFFGTLAPQRLGLRFRVNSNGESLQLVGSVLKDHGLLDTLIVRFDPASRLAMDGSRQFRHRLPSSN
jgi:hypothetical protein